MKLVSADLRSPAAAQSGRERDDPHARMTDDADRKIERVGRGPTTDAPTTDDKMNKSTSEP